MSLFWKNKKVFITGASGFIGSWLCSRLLKLGSYIVILLPDPYEQSELIRSGLIHKVKVVHGHLEEIFLLQKILKDNQIDTVFHLGAQTQVRKALINPFETFETNVRGTYTLLEACRLNSSLIKRIIIASSDKSYGNHLALPFTEETPLQARYPYDVSKACTDMISLSYYHTYHLPIAITRCGNVYGGGDFNWDRLIPGTLRNLYHNKPPIIRSDGLHLRDYVFIQDIIKGYLAIGEYLESASLQGEVFNLSTNHPSSVLDIVNTLAKFTHKEYLTPIILNQADNEIPHQYLTSSKAKNILSWTPSFSLEEGLHLTTNWYLEYMQVAESTLCTTS